MTGEQLGGMHGTLEFLLRHGYVVLPALVFAEQVGLPFPATPFLLGAGALAGRGHLSFWFCLALSAISAVLADGLWYQLGRKKGISVLSFFAAFRWSRIRASGGRKASLPSRARVPCSLQNSFLG